LEKLAAAYRFSWSSRNCAMALVEIRKGMPSVELAAADQVDRHAE
jgi:hypothetical protein